MSDRIQSVRTGNTNSFKQEIPFGAPQGFILSPILFTIYVNMAQNADGCELIQYAYNAQFLHTGSITNIFYCNAENSLNTAKPYFQSMSDVKSQENKGYLR